MKFLLQDKNQYPILSKRVISWAVAFFMFTTTLIIYSGTAYAGLFSFLGSFFEGNPAVAKTVMREIDNLQTLTLLQAVANPDSNGNKISDTVPVAGGETLMADIAENSEDGNYNTQISTYSVREGDTISSVAKIFNVSVNTVLWANNLNGKSVLKIGQTLTILPVTGITYTIKKGDTIETIAKKSGADIVDILNYNDLTLSTPLQIGQSVIVPDGELSTVEIAKSSSYRGSIRGVYEPLLDNVRNLPYYQSCDFPIVGCYYLRPVEGGYKSQNLHGHNGVDIAGVPVGAPIIASAAGTVIISRTGGWNGGYGDFVAISHNNGTQTLYAHMIRTAVSVGEAVTQGQVIGYLGSTGNSTGPHVHFEIRGAQNIF